MGEFQLNEASVLNKLFTAKNYKIQEINLQLHRPLVGLDHMAANTFRHIGRHAKVWRSCALVGMPRFPPNLNYFRNLEVLDIAPGQNDSHGIISTELPDLSMLTKMRDFNMGGFRLSGQFPQWIDRWPHLERFCACNTRLEGRVPDSIRCCTKLTKFCILNTRVSEDLPPGILECKHMATLKIRTTKSDSRLRRFDHFWKAMPDLETFQFSVGIPLEHVDFSCIRSHAFTSISATSNVSPPPFSLVDSIPKTCQDGTRICCIFTVYDRTLFICTHSALEGF
jgi:hypothetical protein